MGPRRRRWRRRAFKAALAALAVALVALVASGGGEELLSAALAAWGEGRGSRGEGRDEGEWGMGSEEAGGWGMGGFVNGGRGKGAWLEGGGRGRGAWPEGANENWEGGGKRGWGVLNGSGIGGPGGGIEGLEGGIGGPGAKIGGLEGEIGGPGGGIEGPEGGIRGPGAKIGGPGDAIRGPGGLTGGLEGGNGGLEGGNGGPGAVIGGPGGPGDGIESPGGGIEDPGGEIGGPPIPPACLALLSGDPLPSDPPGSPRILLSPPPCAPPSPFLLLLIPSALPHLQRRLAVRDTWGGPWPHLGSPRLPTRTIFVLGTSPSPLMSRQVLAESRQHRDILQGDFRDTYAHLSLKTLLLLRWARSCCGGAPFLLKADDDAFVHVPAVATYLSAWRSRPDRLYLGRVHWAVRPNRDPRSRHYVAERVYRDSRFPPYCSGTAYVLSRQAVWAVLEQAGRVAMEMPEDVWVGVCAARAGVTPRHWARFGGSWKVPAGRCCLGRAMLSSHRVGPAELRGVWGRLREGFGGCGEGEMGALGVLVEVLRCRVVALGEWVWGRGE